MKRTSKHANRMTQKAQAAMEYIVLICVILFAFAVIQKYMARGLMGRWKGAGDSFGHGRQYDPNRTTACAYDFEITDSWYDRDCYFANNCDMSCVSVYSDSAACAACIGGCHVPECT